MNAVERHGRATDRALAYLRTTEPRIIECCVDGVGVDAEQLVHRWRCRLEIPHPADSCTPLEVTATGYGRVATVELARQELRNFLVRFYEDTETGRRVLNDLREAMEHEQSMAGCDRVNACLRHRGVPTVDAARILALQLQVRAAAPGRPVLVGDVVQAAIADAPEQLLLS